MGLARQGTLSPLTLGLENVSHLRFPCPERCASSRIRCSSEGDVCHAAHLSISSQRREDSRVLRWQSHHMTRVEWNPASHWRDGFMIAFNRAVPDVLRDEAASLLFFSVNMLWSLQHTINTICCNILWVFACLCMLCVCFVDYGLLPLLTLMIKEHMLQHAKHCRGTGEILDQTVS